MDVTYNNVLESTRQYFQGVPPAASGISQGGQHVGGGGSGLELYNVQSGQTQSNGPNNYYQQQPQQQRHYSSREPGLPQQAQSGQPVPSYLTNGGGSKTHYPSPSPSPHEIRVPSTAPHKNLYSPHPQSSPSPQDHRLSTGSSSKPMYSPRPPPSQSPQENIRLPSMAPFNNLVYANQLQAQRSRHTPPVAASNVNPSSLPPISQLKPPASAPGSTSNLAPLPARQSPLPAPTPPPGIANYQQRQVNGGASTGGRYSGSNSFYYQNQSLLLQQYELQQQQQQLQQQLQQQQREELKQQQAFYTSLTNLSHHQSQSHHSQGQPQHRPQSRDYPPSQTPGRNSAPSRAPTPAIAPPRTSTSRATPTNTGPVVSASSKRESPLDLSVKTVRQSADSTGENSNSDVGTTYYYFQQEGVRGHQQNSSSGNQHQNVAYTSVQPATTPKVDFSPNFSQHAHILQSHQSNPQSRPQGVANYQQQHQTSSQQQPQSYQQPLVHNRLTSQPNQPSPRGPSQPHPMTNAEKLRWKNSAPSSFPLPPASAPKSGSSSAMPAYNPANLSGSNNMPGTSGHVGLLSGHYHVNHLGQTIPKPSYPQEPSRYPQNYLKRPPTEDQSKMSSPAAPKQPKISTEDRSWKASIDQQIEKRFNSYLSSKGIPNGEVTKAHSHSSAAAYPVPPARNIPYSQQVPPHQQSALLQHGYPLTVEKNSTSSSGHSSGSGGGAADKRVLSILRNSLETKEARLQQQLAKSPLQYTELTTRPASSIQQMFPQNHRQPLPAFQSLGPHPSHRENVPGHPRLSIPKAMDSIKESNKNAPPYSRSDMYPPSFRSEYRPNYPPGLHQLPGHHRTLSESSNQLTEVVDITKEEPKDLVNLSSRRMSISQPGLLNSSNQGKASGATQNGGNPLPSSKGDFDGLAAFFAARIRTKAELKQQPPSDQPPTSASNSTVAASLSSSSFRPPYNDLVKTTSAIEPQNGNSKNSQWASSTHRMARDHSQAASFPRRRLFSKGEEDQGLGADREIPPVGALPPTAAFLPPRSRPSHRSSSETSVFDFRESDSEGEAPSLERQAVKKPISNPTNAIPQTPPAANEVIFPPTPLEEELKPEETETYEEWLQSVDELVVQVTKEQLKRAKRMPAKKHSGRGGKSGGRGAVSSDLKSFADITPPAIKQEVMTDAEESPILSRAHSTPLGTTIKEEVLDESEITASSKELSSSEVTLDSKDGLIGTRLGNSSGRGRGGRGRGRRGGGPGSRGGKSARTKKALYGDGSDFKTPGWEEEVYKFKKSLRMPHRLINISRPPSWPKPPLSLPDLEVFPDSPMTNDSQDNFPGRSKVKKEGKEQNEKPPKDDDKRSIAKSLGEDQSFLDRLMAKYTARKKKSKKETSAKEVKTEDDAPELLPTPSLLGAKDPGMLGFRKETINEFREEFLKSGTFTAEADLPPAILETRTRTENKLYHERMTIREVFGTERPASAPPPGTTTDDLRRRQRLRKKQLMQKKKRMIVRAKKEKLQQDGSGKAGKSKFRRKLKSSGFDYLKKPKKKPSSAKKTGDTSAKPKKKQKIIQMTDEEIEDTIKSWTLNKSVGETALHRAAKNGNVDVVRFLVDKLEMEPSPRDNAGYTPLHEACSRGHVAVVQLLLTFGASVEDSALGGVRPLHEAAENGFTKVVRVLLDYGADPLLATYSGVTALSLAAADEESRLLMEQHISENGSIVTSVHNNMVSTAVPKEANLDGIEIEESEFPLPTLYRLSGEHHSWVLFHELVPLLNNIKSKEALCKELKQDTVIRDMKLHEFYAKAHARAIKAAPPTECPNKTSKLTLVKYTDEIKELLGVETTVIPR